MTMIEVDAPDPLNGTALAGELRDAGYPVGDDGVLLDGSTLRIHGVGEDDRDGVESVVADHVPPDPPPDPDEELSKAIKGVRDGASSQDVVDLCDALLGNTSAGKAAGRPTS